MNDDEIAIRREIERLTEQVFKVYLVLLESEANCLPRWKAFAHAVETVIRRGAR